MKDNPNQNFYKTLIIGDTTKIYEFCKSAEEHICVQFIEWNKNIITKAKFIINNSDTTRYLYKTGICLNSSGEIKMRLSVHSIFIENAPSPPNQSVELEIDNIKIAVGDLLQLTYIKYNAKELYDASWSCVSHNRDKPNVKKGNILQGGN